MTESTRHTLRSACLAALLLSRAAFSQPPSAPSTGILLAANQFARTLSLIDPVTGHEIAVIPEDRITGHEVAASPDGRTAFVPIYGNSGVGKPGTDGQEILVIDLPSRKVIHVIDLGHGVRPHKAVFNSVDHLLYVTTELDQTITVIDPHTFAVIGTIPTGQPESHMLAIAPDGLHGYTANVSTGTVSVLDLKARKTLAVIPVAKSIQRIALSPDGSLLFTADVNQPELDVLDVATRTVKARVPLPAHGYGTIATADGRSLVVAMPEADQLAVIDLASMKVTKTIPVPAGPQEALLRPDGRVIYVSCMHSRKIVAIDTQTFAVTTTMGAGDGVDGLAWAGAGQQRVGH